MHNFRADLHTHTYYSDGSLSPEALIQKALEASVQALSITDHDSVAAYHQAIPFAQKNNIPLLAGIELSAYYKNHSVHILGYGFNLNNTLLLDTCAHIKTARLERNRIILNKLKQCRIIIEEAELEHTFPQRTIGRPHIAQMMVQKGYVQNIKAAFTHYLGTKGRCASPPLKVLTIPEALHVIQQAGGIAVLAHPHVFKNKKLIHQLLTQPNEQSNTAITKTATLFDSPQFDGPRFDGPRFDGIEAYYSLSPPHMERPIIDIAKTYNLIITGGSDFHGDITPHVKLGCSFSCETTFNMLYARHIANNTANNTNIS